MVSSEFALASTCFAAMISLRYAFKWSKSHGVFKIARYFSNSVEIPLKREKHLPPPNDKRLSEEAHKYLTILDNHHAKVPRLTFAEKVHTLIHQSNGYGVLSTNSFQYPGFPSGSVVGFEFDEDKKPFFILSSMSTHTKNLLKDGRCSLVVMAKNFQGADDGRVSILGTITKLSTDVDDASTTVMKDKLREKYLKRHQNAYWIDFGDFSYFKMDTIEAIRYVGGFAQASNISPEDYFNSSLDPFCSFAEPVMKHMNDDHADANKLMIEHYVGIPCSQAKMIGLDKLGMVFLGTLPFLEGEEVKIRVPFTRPPEDRKQVKDVIIEMTKAAQSSIK